MSEVRARVESFRKRLEIPFVTSRGTIPEREGCLLFFEDGDGTVGRGEASPAYWIDGEPVVAVRSVLESAVRLIAQKSYSLSDVEQALLFELNAASGDRALAEVRKELLRLPSARAAIDSACLELRALHAGKSVAACLGGNGHEIFPVSALLSGRSVDEVHDGIEQRARQGYRTVKLKVGGSPVETDAARLNAAVRSCREYGMRLRVDANRAWTPEQATRAFDGVNCECIEFVEEPLRQPNVQELVRLRNGLSIRIALDESLDGVETTREFAESGGMDVVVAKLARFGGLRACLEVAAVAANSFVTTVFTDSIETEVGTAAVVHTAAAHSVRANSKSCSALGLGGLVLFASRTQAPPVLRVSAFGPGLGIEQTCKSL